MRRQVKDPSEQKTDVCFLDGLPSKIVVRNSAAILRPDRFMTREQLDKWCERGILVLVLAVLVFGPLATGAVRPLEFLIIQGLTVGAVLLWLLRLWLNPKHRLLWPPICWAVLAFVIYAIVRYQQADIEYVARQELIRILVYAVLFFVVLNNLARQESAPLLTFVLIFLGMAISMYAIYQFATDSEYVWHFIKPEGYRKRGSGTYICPNHLAGFLEMLLPLGLSYTLIGRLGQLLRVFLGYASIVMLAGIGVTVSRGGWVATIAASLLFFVLLIRRRQYRIPILIIVAALIAAGLHFYSKADSVQKRFHNVLSGESTDTVLARFILWKPSLRMWQDHCWLGVGPGHYDYRFPQYRPTGVQLRPGHAHNDYLNTLADWGVVGFSMVAASFALLLGGIFETWKSVSREPSELGTKPSNRAAFGLGGSIGLSAILIHSFTDFNMHVPANAILVVTLMALLSGHLRYATERYWLNPRGTGRILVTLIGLVAMVYLGQQGWRRAREYVWLERAAKEKFYSQNMISALKKAAAIEPTNSETGYSIGEALRQVSWQGDTGYEKFATQAIEWFQRAMRLDPYNPYNFMRIGMCLDWLGRHEEAAPYFEKALSLDPNDYYTMAHQGWHFFQTGDYARAKEWFERAIKLEMYWHTPIASHYLPIVERKLKETKTSKR